MAGTAATDLQPAVTQNSRLTKALHVGRVEKLMREVFEVRNGPTAHKYRNLLNELIPYVALYRIDRIASVETNSLNVFKCGHYSHTSSSRTIHSKEAFGYLKHQSHPPSLESSGQGPGRGKPRGKRLQSHHNMTDCTESLHG